MKPKVSIIIPNYNHASFLQQRLDSVFNQTFQDFEVILLDDASTDKSVQLLDKYKLHPKVSHFVINEENSGSPFKQWQKGIALAKGDYIWIAESDDYNDLTFLEHCMHKFNTNGQVGLVATSLFEKNSDTISVFNPFKSGVYSGFDFLEQFMLKGNSLKNGSSILFTLKEINVNALKKLTEFRICGDWWLWLNILNNNDLYFIDKPLTTYRKHEVAVTKNLMENPEFYREILHLLKCALNDKVIKQTSFDNALQFWVDIMHIRNLDGLEKHKLINKFRNSYSIRKRVEIMFIKTKQRIKKALRNVKNLIIPNR